MTLSRRASAFLVAVGVWTWAIWPRFLAAIWADDRSWDGGPTSFLTVHVLLVAGSLLLGTGVGWIGVRGLRGARARPRR
jgi:hypothetical protein